MSSIKTTPETLTITIVVFLCLLVPVMMAIIFSTYGPDHAVPSVEGSSTES